MNFTKLLILSVYVSLVTCILKQTRNTIHTLTTRTRALNGNLKRNDKTKENMKKKQVKNILWILKTEQHSSL